MNRFKVLTVGIVGAVLAACSSGGAPQNQVGNISISPTTVQVGANQSKGLTATVKDSAGKTLSNIQVNWEVMDGEVAKVVSKGKLAATLTGLKTGETEVYAVVGDVQSAPVSVVVSGNNPGPTPPPPPGPTPPPPPGPTPPPPPAGNGFSGTVFAPTGGDVKDTILLACAVAAQECNTQDPRTKRTIIGTAGASAKFNLEVAAGDFMVVALKDANKNGEFDNGDYFVCFGGQSNNDCAIVRPPKQNIELRLKIVGGNPTPEPEPEPEPEPTPGESSISGQVFAVAGSNLSRARFLFCDGPTNKCQFTEYTGSASQASYRFDVPSGKYYVAAWRDVNGNKDLDAGDHFGCFGPTANGGCTIFAVNGAVTGKDIRMQVLAGGGEAQSFSKSLMSQTASVSAKQLQELLKR